VTHGPSKGIFMNKSKTKILTLPENFDTQATLAPTQFAHLQEALALLDGTNSEIKGGFRLLGQPIGSDAFAASFLQTAAANFATSLTRLSQRITDPQLMATLFKFCALPSISHLLAADILLQTSTTDNPSLTTWSSPFVDAIQTTSEHFLLGITRTPGRLPLFARHLAFLPMINGGLGFRDPSKAAHPAVLVPLIRTIRYAAHGIPYRRGDKTHTLAPIYSKWFTSWKTARHPTKLIRTFRHYLPALHEVYNNDLFVDQRSLTIPDLVLHAPARGLQSQLYRHLANKAFLQCRQDLDTEILDILPSLLSPTTSVPMHSLPRRFADHRLPPDTYRLLLLRKLRLPLFNTDTPPRCPFCPKHCDLYGDHLFSCGFSKKCKPSLHNHIRDTVYTILSLLAPLAGLARTTNDIQREPKNRLPEFPQRRPLDVVLDLVTPTNAGAISIGVDVTIPHVSSSLSKKSYPSIPLIFRTHLASIRSKLQGSTSHTAQGGDVISALNAQHIALIPLLYCGSPWRYRPVCRRLPLPPQPLPPHSSTTHPTCRLSVCSPISSYCP
jgi:hypothetical protein